MLKNKKIYLLQFIVVLMILIITTSLPGKEIPDLEIFKFDKLIHSFAYFVFGISFYLFRYMYLNKISNKNNIIYTLIFCSFYGILDELHQIFIPGRTASIIDFIADFVGVILSLILYKSVINYFEKYK